MRKRIAVFAMHRVEVICMTVGAALAIAVPALADPNVAAANAAMASVVQRANAPGAGFAVGAGGRIVDFKGFGYADVDARTPVGPDTMFALASCSKPITAMAIMKLVEERKVTLETAAFAFLGLRDVADPRAAGITIKNLLNHSSGLPHDVTANTDDPMNTARAAARAQLQFAPGTQQAYSNAGFNVLGAIIEKASGQRYMDFVEATVFRPAGVSRFGALESAGVIRGQAVRYAKNGRLVANKRAEGGTPAGGWILSPSDMVRILMAYDAGKIVSPASRAAMLAPPVAPLRCARTEARSVWAGTSCFARAAIRTPCSTERTAASKVRARGSSIAPKVSTSPCSTTAATAAARIVLASPPWNERWTDDDSFSGRLLKSKGMNRADGRSRSSKRVLRIT